MGEIRRTSEEIGKSERVRVTILACFTGVLAVAFLVLLIADGVQAAGL